MAIKIKRSQTTATPASLEEGQLAYSENSDNLFIGTSGASVTKIGGNADVTKLAGIEALADVTDEANVTAAFPLDDTTSLVYDGGDNTKQMRIDVGAVATATTRVATMPDKDILLVDDADVVKLTGAQSIGGDKTFSNNVIVTGNLTVNGTTTSVNSNEVNIGDNIIVLNSDEAGTPSQDGGIEVERGTETNARLQWNETSDYWEAGLAGSEVQLVTAGGAFHDGFSDFVGNEHIDHSGVSISGTNSISGGGDITTNRTLELVNDEASPGNDKVYGTNGSGTKGWYTAPSGVTVFTGLTDTPANYSGAGGYHVKVNSGATALEFVQHIDDGTF